ncbi:MAG: glycogen debranching N-terminal domain-containing protein [Georgenia sp.]
MAGLQPLLHDLHPVLAAPLQVWGGPDGTIAEHGAQGMFFGDERVVRALTLTSTTHSLEHLCTLSPTACSAEYIAVTRRPEAVVDPLVTLVRRREVTSGGVAESLDLVNDSDEPEHLELLLELRADATPMEAVKQGLGAAPVAALTLPRWSWRDAGTSVHLVTDGRTSSDGDTVRISFTLEAGPRSRATARWHLAIADAGAVVVAPRNRYLAEAGRDLVARSEPRVGRYLARAVGDLDALLMAAADAPEETFLAAGAPWFFTLFGRDSIIAASMLLPLTPRLAGSTLTALARLQGTRTAAETAEQPGKILHEVRREVLELKTDGGRLTLPPVYFGTIDATPLWIVLLHDAWRAGLDEERVRSLLPHLEPALAWMRDHGDADGDGFLEYQDTTGTGLANQGWKDSGDSVRWHSGALAEGPIALSEVQGYAYRAALVGADLMDAFGLAGADGWRTWAVRLRNRFREAFWVEGDRGRYPAIALDVHKRPVDSISSNMGHLLGTGILDPEEARLVAARLVDPTMFSGFGLRTVSTTNGGYAPLRYHAGSVWPHDTAMAIEGLLAEGLVDEAKVLAGGLLRAAEAFDHRLPELFGGHSDNEVAQPLAYPAACRPQAWSAAAAVVVARALRA